MGINKESWGNQHYLRKTETYINSLLKRSTSSDFEKLDRIGKWMVLESDVIDATFPTTPVNLPFVKGTSSE